MVRERNRREWWKLTDRDVPPVCLLSVSALSIEPPSLDMPITMSSSYYIEFMHTISSAASMCDFIDGRRKQELG